MAQDIIVTGGNGFIGTAVVQALVRDGHSVTVVDETPASDFMLSLGVKYVMSDYVEFFEHATLHQDTVIHLAARHIVSDSVADPSRYYNDNVVKTKQMLDLIKDSSIKNIMFSSTGSTYGNRSFGVRLTERSLLDPVNPYASTKMACEYLIKDYAAAYGFKYVIFRFFNAAGADPRCQFGYTQDPPTHVIPIMCQKVLNGEPFYVYGDDYHTNDGSCVRDYVHISDIARAHTLGLDYIIKHGSSDIFNLGGDSETSVLKLVQQVEKLGIPFSGIFTRPRRPGDPDRLVADISRAKDYLGWSPKYDVREIIMHSMAWEKKLSKETND